MMVGMSFWIKRIKINRKGDPSVYLLKKPYLSYQVRLFNKPTEFGKKIMSFSKKPLFLQMEHLFLKEIFIF